MNVTPGQKVRVDLTAPEGESVRTALERSGCRIDSPLTVVSVDRPSGSDRRGDTFCISDAIHTVTVELPNGGGTIDTRGVALTPYTC